MYESLDFEPIINYIYLYYLPCKGQALVQSICNISCLYQSLTMNSKASL